MSQVETEVLIIGGGIAGTAIARELSKYKVDATLVEKGPDFGQGITKCSTTLVCQGANVLEFRTEYHNSRLVWAGMPLMEPLCRELNVPFKRIGSLELIKDKAGMRRPQKMMQRFKDWRDTYLPAAEPPQFIDQETLRSWEPNINKKFIGAVYDPNIAINDPVRLTIAMAENARQNGIKIMTETEVLNISAGVDEFEVQTNNGSIKCRFIVNAAGEYVGELARMVNGDDFVLYPVKSYQAVLDKKLGGLISHMIHPEARWDTVTPTVHGNLFFGIGEGTRRLGRAHDHSTDKKLADVALKQTQDMLPDVSGRDVINSYVGFIMYRNYETGWHECTIGVSRWVPRFINASIGFPGICVAPAAAKEIVEMLAKEGVALEENPNFNPYRQAAPVFSELCDEEKRELIAKDPRYGHVVCRCETVTEGEIVEAIKNGARTLDGVKFRCRPGMGRCQGGFCSPRVIKILARELGISEQEVTKKGGQSQHLIYRSKELLEV